jgi:hypothetical protein
LAGGKLRDPPGQERVPVEIREDASGCLVFWRGWRRPDGQRPSEISCSVADGLDLATDAVGVRFREFRCPALESDQPILDRITVFDVPGRRREIPGVILAHSIQRPLDGAGNLDQFIMKVAVRRGIGGRRGRVP